jgi:hypothetical protein
MAITGYISVGLPIGPGSVNDPYYVTDPKFGLGGLRTVTDITERNSIISQRREVGMMVYVQGDNKYYYLSGGTGNSYWIEFTGGSGGGGTGAVSSIIGTTNEIEVSSPTGNVTIGLPNDVKIASTLNIGGITIGVTGGNSLVIYGGLDIIGNINTSGTLIVDGLIITKTAFQGFTGNDISEPIENVTLDGENFKEQLWQQLNLEEDQDNQQV